MVLPIRMKKVKFVLSTSSEWEEKFAESTDYSVDFISLVERGINTPFIEGCQRIADALQISLSELFDFELPPMP